MKLKSVFLIFLFVWAGVLIPQSILASKIYFTDTANTPNRIARSDLNGTNVENLLTTGLIDPFAIAVDAAGGKVYWSDSFSDTIKRMNLDGTNVETVVSSGLSLVTGIALDIPNGNIYWSDSNLGKIRKSDLDGSNAADVISFISSPRGLALDLRSGSEKIYYSTDTGLEKKIHRADLDGSNAEDLVSGLNTVRNVTLDLSADKVYWLDSGTFKIQRSNLDGTTVEDVITSGLAVSFDLAVDPDGGKVYWAELAGNIDRANLDGTGAESFSMGGSLQGVDLLLSNTPIGTNVEVVSDGGNFTIEYEEVTAKGLTTLAEVDSSEANSFLSDQEVGAILPGTFRNISFTDGGVFDTTAGKGFLVKFHYDQTEFDTLLSPLGFQEEALRLFHDTGSAIEDITASSLALATFGIGGGPVDTSGNFVYGFANSFSNFGIGVNPEPATLLLLSSALLGLLPFKRRRQ